MRASPRRRSGCSPTPPSPSSRRAHGKVPGSRAGHPRPRPARRRGADPCLRPRPHLSVQRQPRGGIGRPQAAARHRLFQPAGAAGDGRAERADRGRAALRRRHRLRPSGTDGLLAISLESFAAYQSEQRLDLRAYGADPGAAGLRLGGGPGGAGRRSSTRCCGSARDPAKLVADAVRMRARHARATSRPSGPFDIKRGEGGLVDLEFAVHMLQLTHQSAFIPISRTRSRRLIAAGLVAAGDRPAPCAC